MLAPLHELMAMVGLEEADCSADVDVDPLHELFDDAFLLRAGAESEEGERHCCDECLCQSNGKGKTRRRKW